jgi:hypothetical protein
MNKIHIYCVGGEGEGSLKEGMEHRDVIGIGRKRRRFTAGRIKAASVLMDSVWKLFNN